VRCFFRQRQVCRLTATIPPFPSTISLDPLPTCGNLSSEGTFFSTECTQLGHHGLTKGVIMKKVFVAALLTLPLLAIPARADGCVSFNVPCYNIGFGFNVHCHGMCQTCGTQLGPWYNYFPYEAHFQSAAPIGYPYWPAQQTLPPAMAGMQAYPQQYQPVPPSGAQVQAPAYQAPVYQQVGYYYQSAPSYWYGR
jgi:hypothetical protein